METSSKKLIRRAEKDGWVLVRISGSHRHFKKDGVHDILTIPHPKKDIAVGTVRKIYRIAGWPVR